MATSVHPIDLYSDTQTRPTPGMREAMARASVGDEQRGADPTTTRLCEMVAELLGKEAAVLMPSGSMCNHVAILVHCRPGDEIIAADNSHIIGSEAGGAAALAGAQIRAVPAERGIFGPEAVTAAVRPAKRNAPRSRLVEVEQTVNRGGGAIWPLPRLEAVAEATRAHGLALHMDGARLLNAAVASGLPAAVYAATCDTVWLDLSKGLGCPVGGVLAGSHEFIEEAWRWKHRLGGAMRQSGMLAAAGIYALENHVERLADDHALARRLAEGLGRLPGVRIVHPVETNMVYLEVSGTGLGADEVARRMLARGVHLGAQEGTTLRAVTHLDLDEASVDEAIGVFGEILAEAPALAH